MIVLCSATAVTLSIPLIRRYDYGNTDQHDAAIYHDQLNEVDRDQSAGTINAPEADAARTEIQRRLAAVPQDLKPAQPLSSGWKALALASTSGLVILGGVILYGYLGEPDLRSVSNMQVQTPVTAKQTQTGQVEAMIEKLKLRLQASPNDAEGWRTLGWAQFNTQRYAESAEAYAKALVINPSNADYKSAYAEALVQSSGGIVIPKAELLIQEVLAKDPKEYRARFYDALGHEQSGDQNGALDRWISLLADSLAEAGWRDDVTQRIANLSKATGRNVIAATNAPKLDPTTPQKSLAVDEKNAMVAGMIAKLATKLDANPKDLEGWAMMIRSLAVTGDEKGAEEALAKALYIFKDDKVTLEVLKNLALAVGIDTMNSAPNGTAIAVPQ